MSLPRSLFQRLPNLKLVTIIGMSLPNLDVSSDVSPEIRTAWRREGDLNHRDSYIGVFLRFRPTWMAKSSRRGSLRIIGRAQAPVSRFRTALLEPRRVATHWRRLCISLQWFLARASA